MIQYTGGEQDSRVYIKYESLQSDKKFTSAHWDEPNVVVHARVNDRVDAAGKPGLMVKEIQSEMHQKGRKQGYVSSYQPSEDEVETAYQKMITAQNKTLTDSSKEALEAAHQASAEYNKLAEKADEGKVPDAPWKTTWHEMIFRRLVRLAAEEGKDWLGWTTGEQQAERYDLSKKISRIGISPALKKSGCL